MNKFLERINAGEILVADGATGSNLQKMGLKPGRPPEDLVIDGPEIILKLASSFVEAGSDIILTCTFGGTRMRMKDSKYQDRTPEVNLRAAQIARQAAIERPGIRVLQRHFKQLECFTPLPTEASGLVVYTQDKRIARKLAEDIESLEQECIVEVKGDIAPNGLQRLCHGLSFNGRPLPPIKVSWQSETKLRFALKGIRPGQIPSMCEAVGLTVVGIKRIRIGRVPLAKVPEGQWRYLQPWERF